MKNRSKRTKAQLERMRLPELQAEYAKIVGEPTRSPNRTFLIRKIGEASTKKPGGEGAERPAKQPVPGSVGAKGPNDAMPRTAQRGRFVGLSVSELRSKYVEVVGRETESSDRAYLIWKIREAEKGRVPVGPRKVRVVGEMTTLPFRVLTAAVEEMDEVWREHGVKSRNRFLQDAVGHYLDHLGAEGVARRFATAAAS